jgi:hypothetical protein
MSDGRHARHAHRRPGRYRGSRRSGRSGLASQRRLGLVVLAVGAVLIGSGALARTLPELPVRPPGLAGPYLVAPPEPGGAGAPDPPAAPTTGGPPVTPTSPNRPAPTAPVTAGPPTGPPASPTPTPPGAPSPAPTATATPTEPPEPTSYEAEAAELSGFVTIYQVPEASGGEVVGMIGRQANNYVRFAAVTVDRPGEYALMLYYVSAPQAEGAVAVNGGEPVTVRFPAMRDWQRVGSVSVPVELVAGPNKIWYGRPDGPAPALDRITVGS